MLVEGSYLADTEKVLEALKKARRQMIRDGEIAVGSCVYTCVYIYTQYMFTSICMLCDEPHFCCIAYSRVLYSSHIHTLSYYLTYPYTPIL